MFPIGQFSQITGLSVKTLHFYDENGLLKPARVDPSNNYRYYDSASIERARIIARLRELQFPLDTIQAILADCTDDTQLLPHLHHHLQTLQTRIRADQKTAKALATAIQSESTAAALAGTSTFQITEKTLPPLLIASVRIVGRYEDCGRGFKTLVKSIARHISGKPLCLYHDPEYRETDATIEPAFPIRRPPDKIPSEITIQTLPKTRSLTLIHKGPWLQLGRSYKSLFTELHRRSLTPALPTRETYLKGPGMIFRGNPQNFLTEIQIPLSETPPPPSRPA